MSSIISCRQCEAENPKDAIQCHICGANFQSKGKTIAQLPQDQIKTDNATFVPEELISSKISNWRREYTPFQENENEISFKWSPTPTLFEVGVPLVILSL